MSTSPDSNKTQLVEIAKTVGAILGVPLALFAVTNSVIAQPIVSLFVAIIAAVIISVWVVLSGWANIMQIITAWLALAVVVLAGFVIWPRTMTIEGHISDSAGNPVSNENVELFDVNNRMYKTETDADGYYKFTQVPTGKYRLQVRGSKVEGQTKGVLVQRIEQDFTVPPISPPVTPSGTAPIAYVTLTPTPFTLTNTPMVPIDTSTSEPPLVTTVLGPTGTPTSVPMADTPIPEPSDTATPTPTDTSTPTGTPTSTSTSSPTLTSSNTPTQTHTPTATPTETATPTPVPALLFQTSEGSGGIVPISVQPPREIGGILIDMRKRRMFGEEQYGFSLWEVEIYGPGTGNLALGATAQASSFQNTEHCVNCRAGEAIDGIDGDTTEDNQHNRWASDDYEPQSLEITLPSLQVVDTVVLKWEAAYAIEYSVYAIE